MFIFIFIAHCKHLKQAFNVPNEFLIVIRARPFIAEERFPWILLPPENSVIINGSKGYVESPNRKTGIGSVSFRTVVLSILLNE